MVYSSHERSLHPAQAIVALGSILSSTSIPKLSHVQKACASLLSGQLLRSDGIQGLFEAVLSADEAAGDEVKVEKLEHIARTVISAPSSKVPKVSGICLSCDIIFFHHQAGILSIHPSQSTQVFDV